MSLTGIREASHADSWYEGNPRVLSKQLEDFMKSVDDSINDSALPIPGAKVIIAPHAGYTYSGPCAAWAYKCLDLSKAKRVFILGPSHTYYLRGCAITRFAQYETPFGNLTVDESVVQALRATGKFQPIPTKSDVNEHSLEMHLPYLYKRLSQTFSSEQEYPTIVPILIGSNNGAEEKAVGQILAPYLSDPDNAFIISSDFCHWGSRFDYVKYTPENKVENIRDLDRREKAKDPPVHESIKMLDHLAIDAIASGNHDSFVNNLARTHNTVCGRHPIGVTMAALEVLANQDAVSDNKYRFKFVQYDRSSLVMDYHDSSVSYAAAYAIV
ncbi:UPF0103-domain-containing protein [Xylariaceae sp. FL1019]|nr:UPF0103-domain-containing protein [Xylariaceae sp. FL1019]